MSSIRNRSKPLSTSMTAKHRAGRELLGLRDRGRAVSSTSSHLVGVARHAGEAGRVGVRAPSFQVLHLPGDPAPDRVETLGPAARRPSTLSGGARSPSPLPLCRLGSTSRPSARTCGVPTRDFVPISTRISPSAASGSCSVALAGVARAERMGGARAGRYANLVLEAPRRGTQGFTPSIKGAEAWGMRCSPPHTDQPGAVEAQSHRCRVAPCFAESPTISLSLPFFGVGVVRFEPPILRSQSDQSVRE